MNYLQMIHAQRDAAVASGLCASCNTAPDFTTHSEAGKAEWNISGTCEPCFDKMFAGDDE